MKFIEKVNMEMDANTSAKTVSPEIEEVEFKSPSRAFNQTEVNIFYELREEKILPSQLIDVNRLITKKTMDQLNENFNNQRKKLVNKRNKLNPNGLLLFSPVIERLVEYNDTNLYTLLNLQLVSGLKVVSIPDFHSRIGKFKQIIKLAEEHLTDFPNQDFYILHHVTSDSKDFKDKVTHLTDLGHRAMVLDIWGYVSSLGNLNYLQSLVRKAGYGLWVHSCNLERSLPSTNVSLPHVLTFFGVDTSSKKVFDYRSLYDKKEGKMREIKNDPDLIKYFHEDTVGIWLKSELPQSFIEKLKRIGVLSGGAQLRNKKSKLYEMVTGQKEFQICSDRIHKGEFRDYVNEKECLKNTIKDMRLF